MSAAAELAPTGTLRVAVFTGNPVIGLAAGGALAGTTVDLGRAIAAHAGLPVAFTEYHAMAAMVADADAGVWDLAVLSLDPARRALVDFAPPHLAVDLTFLAGPGTTLRTIEDIDVAGVRVGVARGAATALTLARTLKAATLVHGETEHAVFEALKDGSVHAIAQNRFLLLGLADRLPGARVLEGRFAEGQLAFALPKGRPQALALVAECVAAARTSGRVDAAIAAAGLRGVRVASPGP